MERYYINYIVLCEKGSKRNKNQDNFWCNGKFLASNNNGLAEPIEGSFNNADYPAFAVFDGMGGENHGETAAYLAAKTFDDSYSSLKNKKRDAKKLLLESCYKMNNEICSFSQINHSGHMGTTAAILMFSKNEIFVCNIGDSKIFAHENHKITQLTLDHSASVNKEKTPALTQYLGIPKTEFIIEPYIARCNYQDKGRYLICSDGLTDMMALEEIENIMSTQLSIVQRAGTLMNNALLNGGYDNITIILCDIRKNKGFQIKEIFNRRDKHEH